MNLLVPAFNIAIVANNRQYELRVTQVSISNQVEVFEVTGGRTVKRIVSWRPLERLQGNTGLTYDMHAQAGQEIKDKDLQALEDTITQIRRHIKNAENPVSRAEWIKEQKK